MRTVRRRMLPFFGLLSVSLIGSMLWVPPASADPAGLPAEPKLTQSVPVSAVAGSGEPLRTMEPYKPEPVVWPAAASAVLDVPAGVARSASAAVSVGGLPVRVSAAATEAGAKALAAPAETPGKVKIEVVAPEKAKQAGHPMALKVTRADGKTGAGRVKVEVDYSKFRHAYGADWDSRLGLVVIPACALTTPSKKECGTATPLDAVNDTNAGVVTADVDLVDASAGGVETMQMSSAETVVALAATPGSVDLGTFAKTDYKSSYSWQAGKAGGEFTWKYPMQTPSVPSGLTPDVSLGYSSGAVDGQTNGENVQPAWGEGWNYTQGYVERSYMSCTAVPGEGDNVNSPTHTFSAADQCWRMPNARMVLGGKSTELVLGDDGTWRAGDDDAAKVELVTGGTNTNNYNNEKWKVTTVDGTQYYFGLSQLPGFQAGDRETGSVWGMPVFANHAGEPCFSTNAITSWCSMAYRWNLDYVVDTNGNTMSYWYSKEYNRTALRGDATASVWYDRSGVLDRIEYGTRAGTGTARESAPNATPPARVLFQTGDRCLTASCATHDKANWPDSPWDLDCQTGPCANNMGPSFWTTKRRTAIFTEVWSGTGTSYSRVDEWALGYEYPSTGNSTSPVLWLASITRTGKTAGGSITLPPVITVGTAMQNRADYNPNAGMPNPMKYRITQMRTESGGQIEVSYSAQEDGCKFGQTFPNPDNNSKRCFPLFAGSKTEPAAWGWWHKYVVAKVTEKDLVGGSPNVEHHYGYSSDGASTPVMWANDDGAARFTTRGGYKSYGDWRGYSTVTELTGPSGGTQSQTKTLYYRGLDEGMTDAGETARVATITNSLGETSQDEAQYTGIGHEVQTFNGSDIVSKSVVNPSRTLTGTRTMTAAWAWPTKQYSYIVRTGRERQLTSLTGTSSWRTTETLSTYDSYGLPAQINNKGDISISTDDTCELISYVRNTAIYLMDSVQWQRTLATCNEASATDADWLSGSYNYYDSDLTGAAPTKGNVTYVDVVASVTGGARNWALGSKADYDIYGRPIKTFDTLNRETRIAYTPATGIATSVQTTKVISPSDHVSITTFDRSRGVPLTVTDPNGKVSTGTYDALGRQLKVWKNRATSGTPDVEYQYTMQASAPSFTRSRVLGPNGNQIDSYSIYDGLLRERQVQATAPDGKRAITDTVYDTRGLVDKTSVYYNADSAPAAAIVAPAGGDADVPRQTRYSYDGAGRQLTDELWSNNIFKSKTTNIYGGDRITVLPPAGGVTAQNIFDAQGQMVAKKQFETADINGAFIQTSYTYDRKGQLTQVKDAMDNTWLYEYDMRGRQWKSTDPDTGTTTSTYDNAAQLSTTTDARGVTLALAYDQLGRKTAVHEGTLSGAKRAAWTYDTLTKGQLTSSTRYEGGLAYVSAVSGYDDGYRATGTSVTIPASAQNGALAGTYSTSMSYKANGALATQGLPATGGLPAETLTYSYYNATGAPYELISSTQGRYVDGNSYDYDGQLYRAYYGAPATGKAIWRQYGVDPATRRLTDNTTHTMSASVWSYYTFHWKYTYDLAGNIVSTGQFANGAFDSDECFSYDYLRRLKEAWTTAGGCGTPSRGGPSDPYWRKWTFDNSGNRLTQVDKDLTAGDTTWTYTNPLAGAAKAHTLSKVDATGPKAGTPTRTFNYNAAGYTEDRITETGAFQDLTWDKEGHLASVAEGSNTTSYVYSADGDRLISRAPSKTTLTLPGGQELELMTSGGSVLGTRQYSHNGKTIGIRDASGLKWVITDHLGTTQGQIDALTHDTKRRRPMPYGETRGSAPASWAGNKGYIGGTKDDTGLTHLGAREYDSSTGRFISRDPITDFNDPQQVNGYAYSHNSPVTHMDPDGLRDCDFADCDAYGNNKNPGKPGDGKPSGGKPGGGRVEDKKQKEREQAWLAEQERQRQIAEAARRQAKAEAAERAAAAAAAEAKRKKDDREAREYAWKVGKPIWLPNSAGLCLNGGAAAGGSVNGSSCFMADIHGVGRVDSIGGALGIAGGIYGGGAITISNGFIHDQPGNYGQVNAMGGAGWIWDGSLSASFDDGTAGPNGIYNLTLGTGAGAGANVGSIGAGKSFLNWEKSWSDLWNDGW